MKSKIFPYIIALSAFAVSASAAFYSVYGLSKLFAGASTQVIVMASSLEFAKLVIASLLYQYWETINKVLRVYLVGAITILMLITSGGIYGYLSSAYQDTANKSGVVEKQIETIKTKRTRFEQSKADYLTEKQRLDNDISQLRTALATGSTTQTVDRNTGQLVTRANEANRKTFENQLTNAITSKDALDVKLTSVSDSLTALDMRILDIESNAQLAGELGPLKYLSNLTGKSMDTVINWFLLLIIFVFDPLAIALVVAANMAFEKIQKDHTENIPYISDDFQIGPDGAYEHVDDIADEENDIVEEEDVIEINEDLLDLQESIPEDIYEDKPIEDKPKEPINTPAKPPARARAYWA
jgi:hypothetical protein